MAGITFAHPLFLAQNAAEQSASSPYFPLGLLYLAGYVRERGHHVTIFDGTFAPDESAFVDHLAAHTPEVVGLSAVITNRDTTLRLARLAADTGAIVIVGGPDPTFDPARYLSEPAIDIVVHHEGEQTITRLLDLIDASPAALPRGALTPATLHGEPGIAYRHDGSVVVNEPRPPLDDLDALPLPARDLIDMDRYLHQWQADSGYTSITVATARGCPYGCDWCLDAVHGNGFRQRSPESVAAEVRQLEDLYGVESIRIVDDVDGIDRAWIDRWAEQLALAGSAVGFEALNRLDRTDLPLLDVRDSL